MIYLDILTCVENALGTALAPAQRERVIEVMATHLGGEQRYFQSLPKLRARTALGDIGPEADHMTAREIARRTGLHVRTIQRLRQR
jgi:hypothetical protein